MTYNVSLMHMVDPRGPRVGGTETYVRDYIRYHPDDMNLLYIGPDEIGDLELGKISELTYRGRKFSYLPIYRVDSSLNIWSKSITGSDTFTFAKHILRNWGLVRRTLREGKHSVELRRVEIAPLVAAMGVPYVQMEHILQDKGVKRSGTLDRHQWIGTLAEFLSASRCYKFYLVNPLMTEVFKKRFRPFASKFHTLTTWANPEIFSPRAFETQADTIELVFAGRADQFKRLDIMLDVVRRVKERVGGKVLYHYVGDGDLTQYGQYAAISDNVVRHGRKSAAEVAALLESCHIGLLTSDIEGMPRFVMETLAAGRPVVALHLPQLDPVFASGSAGCLIERGDDQVSRMADAIVEVHGDIMSGTITPQSVAASVANYTPQRLLSAIFADHCAIHEQTLVRRGRHAP